MENYLMAKKDLKRDLIIFFAIAILLSIVVIVFFAYLIVTFSDGHDIPFSDLVILAIVGVFMGLFLSSAITGEVLVFRFVWRTFSGFSIIFLLIMIIIGYAFGWIFTAIHFISGFVRVQKLGKVLRQYCSY